ncbi:MAG: ATP-binding protein [Coriobacteriia bacterium]|nr:ATP-binding protein [Coriobacteriia bacterium]
MVPAVAAAATGEREEVGSRSLARRSFATMFVLCVAVMLTAVLAVTAVSFRSYEREAEDYLLTQVQSCASALQEVQGADARCAALQAAPLADARATLVDVDGTVLFDNYADPATLGNHGQRAEIMQARQSGQGALLRRSDTLGRDTLYAAVDLGDGMVLRLAETRTSLASFLGGMWWQLALSLVVIFVLSVFASRLLTHMVVRPLQEIDLARPLENGAYAELQPLLARVDEQRRALEAQNDELQRAVTMRREFTGNVSHEMKTPLQVIGGYAELMEAGMVSAEDVPRFAGLIRQESEQMRLLIDDVLALSRLDESVGSGEPVGLRQVCDRVVERLAPAADAKDVHVTVDCQDVTVVGVPSSVEQMVYNLVDNAIEYSPEGGIVAVQAQAEDSDVLLSVADQGPGIPDELKERVFERFFRVDASRSRNTGGTGLGLAIVKHAAESMGGIVVVQDAPGGGARFRVRIPSAR